MANIDATGSKLTAVGAIDKFRFLIDAFALVIEQAEAYGKKLVDVDTGIRKDIRDCLNKIDSTYLPNLRDAKDKIADVKLATKAYVDASEKLVSSILSTPTYRQQLEEEVLKVREKTESEEQDNPPSVLASYRLVLQDYLSDTSNALDAWGEATKEAQKALDKLSGTSKELKHDLDQASLIYNDNWIKATVGAGVASGVAGIAAAGFVTTGLAIANVPAAVAICAGLGIAGVGLPISAILAAAGTVGMVFLSHNLWKKPNIQEQERKSCGEALDHVQEIELLTKVVHGNLSALHDAIQVSRADVAQTGAEKKCLDRALDKEYYDPREQVLPALKNLWDAARKHNSRGKDVTAE